MSCRQGLLVTLAVVLEDEDIHGIIEYQPDSQVNEEDPHGTNLSLHTQNRGQHDEHRHEDQNSHRPAGAKTCSEQFMVDMILIGEEGVMMIAQTDNHHAHDIEHGQEHGGKTDNQHLAGEGHT